jgi:RNA polymerase sigma factor (TIGR02999 family)
MDTLNPANITRLLDRWTTGDREAAADLLPLVYQELRDIAQAYMRRERPGHTLQVTGLVHEAFLRLSQSANPEWKDRKHFFGVAARLMRQVLVDYARRMRAEKRGHGSLVAFDENMQVEGLADAGNADYLTLNHCLDRLAEFDPRKAEIVELRFFGGLKLEEVAETMGLSLSSVKRELQMAKIWMLRELEGGAHVE